MMVGGGTNKSPPPFFICFMEKNSAKIVSSAVLGMDFRTAVINGKVYMISPPTIHKIAGAGYYLSGLKGDNDLDAVLGMMKDMGNAAHALSYLINGDDSLFDELSHGTVEEVVNALKEGLSLISVENFMTLSVSARNVANLIAKQKQ